MKVLRYLLCFAVSFASVYLSGYKNFVNDIPNPTAVVGFFGAVLVFSVFAFVILERFLKLQKKIDELSWRVEQLEESKNNKE